MSFQLRRLFGGLRVNAGQTARRGLEEFFPVQKVAGEGAKASSLTQVPASVGTKQVVVGGEWKAWMLREKSTDDLHKLWFVLLKERNALLTELQQCRAKNLSMPNPTRRTKVKKSMARIKLVLHERSQIYKANQAKKAAEQQYSLNGKSDQELRNFFHLRPSLTADFFVPCGGRPAAVNLNNVEQFMYREDGRTLRFKYIVEGANLFFTQDARTRLEDAGVILFKDASANKGGVTSSSLEVLAALSMTDEEFAEHMQVDEATGKRPAFCADYVSEVQKRIDLNAQREFECIWREHERSGTY